MKIALSALQQRHYLTGTGRYIAELYRGLPAAAPSHAFLLFAKSNQGRLFAPDGDGRRLAVIDECPADPMRRSLWEIFNFAGVLRREGVDLYHGPANFLPPRKVCRTVLTLHDMFFFRNPGRTGLVRSLYWRGMQRMTWRDADLILTDSEFSKSEIMRFLGAPANRIRVVYLGVDPAFHAPASEDTRRRLREQLRLSRPYIAYVGRLDPDKNVRRVIEAYALLLERGTTTHDLAIAGAEDYQSAGITDLISKLGIADRARLLGYVPEEFLVAFYQEAAVMCYPSLNEGFGLPPLEAMAAGTPVVTSNVSSIPEIVGDAALSVDPLSVPAIADALAEALLPARSLELRQAGLERSRRFTWENCCARTAEAYEDVLAGRATGG